MDKDVSAIVVESLKRIAISNLQSGPKKQRTDEAEAHPDESGVSLDQGSNIDTMVNSIPAGGVQSTELPMPVPILLPNGAPSPAVSALSLSIPIVATGSSDIQGQAHVPIFPEKMELSASMAVPGGSIIRPRRKDGKERRFKCNVCPFGAFKASHLNEHMRSHSGERPYKCSECNYTAKTNSYLSEHKKTHATEKPFKCENCTFTASKKCHLTEHARTHTGEKPFKCDVCSYTALRRSHLNSHMKTHGEKAPIKCSVCSFEIIGISKLSKHMMTHAPAGEIALQYKCPECAYSTAVKADLSRHRRKHNPERPFKCQWCPDYATTQQGALKRHMKKSHPHVPGPIVLEAVSEAMILRLPGEPQAGPAVTSVSVDPSQLPVPAEPPAPIQVHRS